MEREFKRQILGEWKVDPREVAIMERLQQYRRTTEHMGNRDALMHWKSFKEWTVNSGYTSDDIRRAKRNSSNIR